MAAAGASEDGEEMPVDVGSGGDEVADSVVRAHARTRARGESDGSLAGRRVDLGGGAVAWSPCHVGETADIGRAVSIGCLAHVGRNVRLGADVRIQGGAYVADGCVVEAGAFIGPNATLLNDRHPPSGDPGSWRPVRVGKRSVVGGGATIVAGVSIGADSVVAAGAVATKDVPDGEVWGGVPARRIMDRDAYERNAGRGASASDPEGSSGDGDR